MRRPSALAWRTMATPAAMFLVAYSEKQAAPEIAPTFRPRLIIFTAFAMELVPRITRAQAMELGFDAVLLNSAVALAHDPVVMARAFKLAIEAGRLGYEAGVMAKQDMAVATTPVTGQPFVL